MNYFCQFFCKDHQYDQYGGLGIIYTGYDEPAPLKVLVKKPLRSHEKEQQQDFSKIPGVPGHDYPLYHSVPHTSFSCGNVPFAPGMYANVETGCQVFHFFVRKVTLELSV